MAPIRSKNKKDKLALVTPPSRAPRNTKYLNAGLLQGKTPSEVALLIREPRDPCDDSSELSSSSSPVISATGSIEEEVAEHEEIALGGEYVAYDDDDGDDGDDGNSGDGGDGGNHGNEVEEIQEDDDEGNDDDDDDDEDEDGNGGASGDEEGDEDDDNDENGLYDGVQNSVIAYDKDAISCFTEGFYGEVDAFQFPFGEMALIPEDAEQIIGLQVEGKSKGDKFKKNLDWKKNI
ncbi:secreted acidic protein 1A-like [Papaver somniferum]|uniref:secreted acidic protein 1A-like n=1 Tax=Papaver somniferum TaxID=3469 RepID=UPI000E704D13|nr:secreted acidic protein 1A-like [Papaver somniferum]